ncbi:MAG: YciI family protein, partial [Pseudomonadales bacterium]
ISGYDSLLAAKMGADDYGMRRYVMALLKAGPNRDQDSTEAAQLQRAHLDNITRMAEEGKLVLAGPFFDNWDVKGIYIFAVETVEEAEELTKTDPAIQAGRLIMELHPWYGSAALMQVGDMHKRLAKESI